MQNVNMGIQILFGVQGGIASVVDKSGYTNLT